MTRDSYAAIGIMAGGFIGFIAFIASWIYCISEYGYLLGFGLGWLPSAILTFFVFWALRFLWLPILFIAAGVIALAFM